MEYKKLNRFQEACYFITGLGIWLATYGFAIVIVMHLFGIV